MHTNYLEMDTNKSEGEILLKKEVYNIIGSAIEVLKTTRLRVGLIINFSKPKLEWERFIL